MFGKTRTLHIIISGGCGSSGEVVSSFSFENKSLPERKPHYCGSYIIRGFWRCDFPAGGQIFGPVGTFCVLMLAERYLKRDTNEIVCSLWKKSRKCADVSSEIEK